MTRFGLWAGFVALGIGLAGCQTAAPSSPAHVTEIPGDAVVQKASPVPPTVRVRPVATPLPVVKVKESSEPVRLPSVETLAEPPLETAAVAPPQTPPVPPAGEWTNRWVSVTDWFATNGTGRPSRHFEGDKAVYTLMTTNGPIVLRAGSQVATCNHLNCWLGYAPRFTNGELYLHPLDLQKNLLPAVRSSRMASAAGRVVVIDPGHGGDQPGTRSVAEPEGYEKNYTLDWARRLKPLLEQRGWRVILTRTNDVDVPLTNRVAMAERMKADLFISLHFNSAAPHAGQSGLETYCLTPAGLPSSLVRDYQDDARQVYPNNSHDLENYLYAVQLHRSLLEATGAADRGVRRARFMGVLRGQNRPAILIEGGFLSNPAEARLIARPEYRQKLADAVARALN